MSTTDFSRALRADLTAALAQHGADINAFLAPERRQAAQQQTQALLRRATRRMKRPAK